MDIPLKKRPWFIRYRYYLLAALAFIALLGYAATLALGPRKFRVDKENVQIAEVRHTDFLEYVDVEGIVHPIMTVQVNSLEGGSVARIVGEEGDMVQPGDTLLVLENPQVERNIADKLGELEKQRIEHRRQLLEIDRNRLTLQQQSLQAEYELCNSTPCTEVLPEGFRYAGIISFSGAILSREWNLDFDMEPSPVLLLHGTEDNLVTYKQIKFFNIGFYGSSKIAERFAAKGYEYNIIRFMDHGHEVAGSMYETLRYQLCFLQENVMERTGRTVDALIDDPAIPSGEGVSQSRKELYGGE